MANHTGIFRVDRRLQQFDIVGTVIKGISGIAQLAFAQTGALLKAGIVFHNHAGHHRRVHQQTVEDALHGAVVVVIQGQGRRTALTLQQLGGKLMVAATLGGIVKADLRGTEQHPQKDAEAQDIKSQLTFYR